MNEVVALIPARGGSRGLPGKNARQLAGRPILAYTIAAARDSQVIDRIVCTTDDAQIAEQAKLLGAEVPFLRPAELADDETPMLPVVQHAVREIEQAGTSIAWVAILQPTSPLRRATDVRRAVELARSSGCDSVIGVVAVAPHLSPDYVMRIDDLGHLKPFLEGRLAVGRRQDARPAYIRDGTVYLVRRDVVLDGSLYGEDCQPLLVDPKYSLSIDTEADWREAERRLTGADCLGQPFRGDGGTL